MKTQAINIEAFRNRSMVTVTIAFPFSYLPRIAVTVANPLFDIFKSTHKITHHTLPWCMPIISKLTKRSISLVAFSYRVLCNMSHARKTQKPNWICQYAHKTYHLPFWMFLWFIILFLIKELHASIVLRVHINSYLTKTLKYEFRTIKSLTHFAANTVRSVEN